MDICFIVGHSMITVTPCSPVTVTPCSHITVTNCSPTHLHLHLQNDDLYMITVTPCSPITVTTCSHPAKIESPQARFARFGD